MQWTAVLLWVVSKEERMMVRWVLCCCPDRRKTVGLTGQGMGFEELKVVQAVSHWCCPSRRMGL